MHKCCLPSGVPSESPAAYETSLVHKIFGGSLCSQVNFYCLMVDSLTIFWGMKSSRGSSSVKKMCSWVGGQDVELVPGKWLDNNKYSLLEMVLHGIFLYFVIWMFHFYLQSFPILNKCSFRILFCSKFSWISQNTKCFSQYVFRWNANNVLTAPTNLIHF
jgi:hypothetical protein